jgi:hypothetical protein
MRNLVNHITSVESANYGAFNDVFFWYPNNEFADDLYSGWRFDSSPFRIHLHTHYVPLSVYPFDSSPPSISAGCVLMNSFTLRRFLFASHFTRYYAFDDIYLSILARQLHISPVHNAQMLFWPVNYNKELFKNVISAHGFYTDAQLSAAYADFS